MVNKKKAQCHMITYDSMATNGDLSVDVRLVQREVLLRHYTLYHGFRSLS